MMPGAAAEADVYLRDFGTILTPFLGGPEQYIDRLGTRFALRVTLPAARTHVEAMAIQSRLLQGRKNRLVMRWPQPGFDTGNPGAPLLSAAIASGSTISLSGMVPGYRIRDGQFLSIIHAGRRYMHMATAERQVSGTGALSLPIFPMLRTPLTAGDVVEIAQPMIEGNVSPGEEISWKIAAERLVAFTFTISEGA